MDNFFTTRICFYTLGSFGALFVVMALFLLLNSEHGPMFYEDKKVVPRER